MSETRSGTGGFVLVGVVMFVLALSILGMSLYAVSGYEVAFLGQTRDDYQALYDAQGGLDMVRARLAVPPWRLISAHELEGIQGVVRATAYQTRAGGAVDSLGLIDFTSDSAVTIVLTAGAHGTTQTVSGRFLPSVTTDYYKRLFTIAGLSVSGASGPSGSIWVEPNGLNELPLLRLGSVTLGASDQVWQQSSDTSWTARANWPVHPPIRTGSVPVPDVASYYVDHPYGSNQPGIAGPHLDFNGVPGAVTYFGPPNGVQSYGYSFYSISSVTLRVTGTVVWELPHGLRDDNTINIVSQGPGPATIVIVGSPYALRNDPGGDPNVGLWFFTGLYADPDVNVILVSDGQINLERNYSPLTTTLAIPRLSIFSKGLFLQGPLISFLAYDLYTHPSDMDDVIADLESNDALPHAAGAPPQSFRFVAGTWRDLTP
jgi:hypothetical protein